MAGSTCTRSLRRALFRGEAQRVSGWRGGSGRLARPGVGLLAGLQDVGLGQEGFHTCPGGGGSVSMKAGGVKQGLGTGRGNRRGLGRLRGFFGKSERRDIGDRFRGSRGPGATAHCSPCCTSPGDPASLEDAGPRGKQAIGGGRARLALEGF